MEGFEINEGDYGWFFIWAQSFTTKARVFHGEPEDFQ